MFVSYTRPIDHYEGTKNWNELPLAARQQIIALEFGAEAGDLESFMMSTDLKKAQYRGLRGLSVHARSALENAGTISRNSDDFKDSIRVINYYSGTQFHAEMLALLKGEGSAESFYDGAELEQFGFVWAVPGFKDTLLRCSMEPEVFDGATQEVFQGVQA
jgi:hypothetical protein